MEQKKRYFVCGAIYATSGGEFRLVKPGGGAAPYVWESSHQSTLTEHHSHFYELSDDRKSVKLVKKSRKIFTAAHFSEKDLEDCGAPESASLCEADYKGVLNRIEKGEIY